MAVNVHVIECNVDPSTAPDMVGQHWINTSNGCHFLSNGTATVANWIKINVDAMVETVVAASTTVNLETAALANFCSKQYRICMFNVAQDKWKSLQLYGTKKTATTVEDSVYSVVGDRTLNLDLNFNVVATDAVLEAVNNEAFAITVRYSVETI